MRRSVVRPCEPHASVVIAGALAIAEQQCADRSDSASARHAAIHGALKGDATTPGGAPFWVS